MNFFSYIKRLPIALAGTLVLSQGHAMVALEEEEMSGVSGAGLAFVFDNFSMRMAPTSFIELTGTAAQGASWQRGDARYYGLSISNGAVNGTDWFGNGCSGQAQFGNAALACPVGTDNNFGVAALASAYDPYLVRAYQYRGHDYAGLYRDQASGANPMPTVMELIGPSSTDLWRWAFWGQLEVDRLNNDGDEGAANNSVVGSGGADFLQSQTIIHGRPVTKSGDPAILRLLRTVGQGATNDTFGMTYQSAISGDFRFSVRQTPSSADQLHRVPDFNNNEGMYFKNVDAFLPLGVMHYQALTLDAVRDGTGDATGNFVIELTRIPNIPNIYNHFYCGSGTNAAPTDCATDTSGMISSPNNETRGYVRWGDFTGVNLTTGAGLPGAGDFDNGIYFVGGGNELSPGAGVEPGSEIVTNLGISRIEGMRIHHLKITTLGAGI